MKTRSVALAAHYALVTTTLATCWRVTRRDDTVMGFTDAATNLTIGGVTYYAATGYVPSGIKSNNNMAVDNMEVVGVLDATGITDADLAAGLYDFAKVQIFEVNWADLTQGAMILRQGYLGQVSRHRGAFAAEVRGLAQALQQTIGRIVTPACDADVFDARCKLVRADYTVTGAVVAVTSNSVFTDTTRTEADNYFRYGLLTWTSGLNDGLSMEVKTWTLATHTFELVQAMPHAVAASDAYSVSAGCDKKPATCSGTFANKVNFRGFEDVPGADQMFDYPNAH